MLTFIQAICILTICERKARIAHTEYKQYTCWVKQSNVKQITSRSSSSARNSLREFFCGIIVSRLSSRDVVRKFRKKMVYGQHNTYLQHIWICTYMELLCRCIRPEFKMHINALLFIIICRSTLCGRTLWTKIISRQLPLPYATFMTYETKKCIQKYSTLDCVRDGERGVNTK